MTNLKNPRLSQIFLRFLPPVCGAAVIFVGVIVLVGWITGRTDWTRLSASYAPMPIQTAVSLIFLGLGLVLVNLGRKTESKILSVFPIILGAFCFIQNMLGWERGVQAFFYSLNYSLDPKGSGQLPINTSLLLLLSGLHLFWASKDKSESAHNIFQSIIGFSSLTLALCSLSGYFPSLKNSYVWVLATQLSLPGALAFVVLTIGHLFLSWREMKSNVVKVSYWILFPIFCGSFLIVTLTWQTIRENEELAFQQRISLIGQNLSSQVQLHLSERVQTLSRMAKRLNFENQKDQLESWKTDAKEHLKDFSDLSSISIADSEGRLVAWVTVDSTFTVKKGMDIAFEQERKTAMEQARALHRPVMTSLLKLRSGKEGLLIFVPIYRGSDFKGYLLGVLRTDLLFRSLIPESYRNYFKIDIAHNGQTILEVKEPGKTFLSTFKVEVPIHFLDLNWILRMEPSYQLVTNDQSRFPLFILLAGIFLSIAITLIVYLFQNELKINADLTLANQRFKGLLSAAPDSMIIVNKEGHITLSNAQISNTFGYDPSEILGKNIELLLPLNQDENAFDAEIPFYKDPENIRLGKRMELEALRKDGSRLSVEASFSPVKMNSETLVLASIRDISARKETERRLREQEVKIIFSSKMASLGEMAAGIGHEINNPLAIIQATAEDLYDSLEEGKVPTTTIQTKLKKIESTADRIAKIIRGLRTFARDDEATPFYEVSLKRIITDTLALCGERLKTRGIIVRTTSFPAKLKLFCRPVQISQVLVNLLNNACDALEHVEDKWIEITITDLGATVELKVRDGGRGIPATLREKVMQPFFTTKEPGHGTGLGLSISRGIIEDHGGTLDLAKNTLCTEFIISLPKDPTAPHHIMQPPSLNI